MLSKSCKFDISDVTTYDPKIRDIIYFDIFPDNGLFNGLINTLSFDLELYFCSGLTFQHGAYFIVTLPFRWFPVHLNDLISSL